MRNDHTPSRRHMLTKLAHLGGAAAAAPVILASPFNTAFAQVAGSGAAAPSQRALSLAASSLNQWRELALLSEEAARLGYPTPRLSATVGTATTADYGSVMRATVDLIDTIDASPPAAVAASEDTERLLRKTHALLRRVHQAERMPRQDRPLGAGEPTAAAAVATRPKFDDLKPEYTRLFQTCQIREAHRAEINWAMGKLVDQKNQVRWLPAAQEVCLPWYFVGLTHYMECGLDFHAHLHNGDPLTERTVQVPENRPKVWNPPSDWTSSAVDSLTLEGFANQADWSIARTLYRFETNNGFGSRRNGIYTPYLWSFSNHYARGKFIADGVWDPDAVSKQVGAAVILKAMVEAGHIAPPA
jgi:lysozyme family protein